jgi:hypothetical protein
MKIKYNYSLLFFILVSQIICCHKNNDNPELCDCNVSDTIPCVEGLIVEADICGPTAYFVQILNQAEKIGYELMFDGIEYDNIVLVYNLPEKYWKEGKTIYFKYEYRDNSIGRVCFFFLLPFNAPQVVTLCVSDIDCQHLRKVDPFEY